MVPNLFTIFIKLFLVGIEVGFSKMILSVRARTWFLNFIPESRPVLDFVVKIGPNTESDLNLPRPQWLVEKSFCFQKKTLESVKIESFLK